MRKSILKNKTARRIAFLVLLVAVASVYAGLFYRAEAGFFAWRVFGMGELAYTLNPDPELAYEIGNYYFRDASGDFGEYDRRRAKKYYLLAHEAAPGLNGPLYQLARIDFIDGHLANARNKLNAHLEDFGDVQENGLAVHVRYMRGLTYGYMGLSDEAEKDFLFLIEHFGEDPPEFGWGAYVDLSWIYFKEGRYEDILAITETGLRFFSENPWLWNMHGVALLNLGRKDEAKNALGQAMEMAERLTEDDWSSAYPGNDPRHAPQGLEELRRTIETNFSLAVQDKE